MTFHTIFAVLRYSRYHIIGKCSICGRLTIFLCTDPSTARNNMFCLFCRSSSRKRHVARTMINSMSKDISSADQISIQDNVRIYDLDTSGSLHDILYRQAFYVCSDYYPEVPCGTLIRERTYCQNVENLTFEDGQFDMVVSEDVFEHVRDCDKGFREIYRVLKKGGCHIFTVPCYFDRKTLVRVDTSGAEDELILPEYHEDKMRGKMLAYRTFGIDIFETLAAIGFSAHVERSDYSDIRTGIVDSYVFVARK